jgi:HPt (histidine-containing phosphotransfer) domain-containing protein
MKRLNRVAVESLLLLASTLYGDETLRLLFTSMQEALTKALEADRAGDTESVSGLTRECRRLKGKYEASRKRRIKELRRKIEGLFEAAVTKKRDTSINSPMK